MIHIPKEKRTKLDEKSQEVIFMGYDKNGYRFFDEKSKEIIIRKEADLLEINNDAENRNTEETCLVVDNSDLCTNDGEFDNKINGKTIIPNTYEEAMTSMNADKWKAAMNDEYQSLIENETWILEHLPQGRELVKCKWVYAIKENANGDVIRYKARLVAKGFSQIPGIDYQETFAPVVRYTSIRILLAIAASRNLQISQLDAVTAFLNGNLYEEIYMEQPKHYRDGTNRCCKLKKALYGLK